jgi:hypothetical protein
MKLEPAKIYYLREMIEMYYEKDDHIREHLLWVNNTFKEDNETYAEGSAQTIVKDMNGQITDHIYENYYTYYDTDRKPIPFLEVRQLTLSEYKSLKEKFWNAWKDIAVERNYLKGERSYDIFFYNENRSEGRAKAFMESYEYCLNYINNFGDDDELFERFQGGVVQIVCNETAEVVHEEPILEGEAPEKPKRTRKKAEV